MGYNFRYEAVETNMGSMLVGVILSAVLLGLCLTQTFYYYMKYPKDPWYYQWLVGSIAFMDTVHLVLITHTIYHYLVSNYNNPQELELMIWSIIIEALFTGVTGALVQFFYLTRVWRMSERNKILTSVILFFVIADAACGTVWVILAIRLKTYDDLMRINPLTITINALSTAADCLIAGSLCLLLHRARTGFKKSDSVINKLMIFVVNTGVLTSLCALAALVSLVVSPNTLVYASFYFCIGRLYTNAFLATLNARKAMSSLPSENSHMMVSMPSTLLSSVNGVNPKNQKSSQGISIRINTTTTQEGYPDAGHRQEELGEKEAVIGDDYSTSTESAKKHRPQSMDNSGFSAV